MLSSENGRFSGFSGGDFEEIFLEEEKEEE